MTTTTEAVLAGGTRCLLALESSRAPLVAPMAYYYDGSALWMTTAADTVKVRLLRRGGACALYVAPHAGGAGAVGHGHARVLSLDDPVGLALRAPVITAALAGLALTDPAAVLSYARDAARVPARWRPRNRVVLRVAVEHLALVPPADPPPGVAPALPAVVPADVRRALAGLRRVALARSAPGGVEVLPCWAGAAFDLRQGSGGEPVEAAGAVAVALDAAAGASPLDARGMVLYGPVDGGVLRPERATWWRGFELETADVPAAVPGIVLPD